MEHANGVLHEANSASLSISLHFIIDNKSAAGRMNSAQISVMPVLFSDRLSSLQRVRREDKNFAAFLLLYGLLVLSKEREGCLCHTLTPLRFLKKAPRINPLYIFLALSSSSGSFHCICIPAAANAHVFPLLSYL